MEAVEIRTIAKVTRRIVPFLIVCYFVAYLDRVNVSFAALAMNQDLGLSQTAFGGSRTRPAAMPAACCCWRRLASLPWESC
jgi:sugar phosphate permease